MTPRSTLKDYFKKGKIPRESDFAELIDSMLIQDEDGIRKPANNPLRITATGADETLLSFYRLQGADTPTWQLRQKAADKLGLSVHDGADSAISRLFIESGTGRVGIGTAEPKSPLSVSGGVAIGTTYAKANAAAAGGLIVEGNIGIGTTEPKAKLTVNGDLIRRVAVVTTEGKVETSFSQIRNAPIDGRSLRFTKQYDETAIRILYYDFFSVSGSQGASARWEIHVDEDIVGSSEVISDQPISTTILAYASVEAGDYEIGIWLVDRIGSSIASAFTGSDFFHGYIEAQEVWMIQEIEI